MPRPRDPDGLRGDLPGFHRGCYGCFGPQDTPNTGSLVQKLSELGMDPPAVTRIFRTFNAMAPAFRAAGDAAAKEAVP